MIVRYFKGAEHPDIALTWKSDAGTVIDFSTGYTFELKIGHGGSAATLTKVSGITGAQTSPNLIVVFAPAELDNVPVGLYEAQLKASQTASNKDRFMRFWFELFPAVT